MASRTKSGKGGKEREQRAEDAFPGFVPPALATLQSKPPLGARWLHEIKFDGYRLQAHVRSGRIVLLTRSGHDWTAKFGLTLGGALLKLPVRDAIIDGEVVVEGAGNVPDFSALQDALATGRTNSLIFYAFDLLYLDGRDMRAAPLLERKAALAAIVSAPSVVRYSEHFLENGDAMLRHACLLRLEGVISKLVAAPYRSGRTKDWIKAKCTLRQEFVIAGYVPSTVSATAIGSLVPGYFQHGKLTHAGRVGTGFTNKVAADLFRRLEAIRTPKSPFARKLASVDARNVRFVRPELVGEVEFRAWTGDRLVRHASFQGLREDKRPRDVTVEEPSL